MMSVQVMFCLCLHILFINSVYCFFQYDNIDSVEKESTCKCVPKSLCADNEAVHGEGLFDIRFEDDAQETLCPNPYEVCCEKPIDTEDNKEKPPTHKHKCGLPNVVSSNLYPRITSNSEITKFGELPWTILVLQKDKKPERNAFICGGSLIHPKVVITAGHCVMEGNGQVIVRAGEWNIKNENEPLPHQDRQVAEVLIHPQYKSGILWNDIALLFLKDSFDSADNIGFICLPPPGLKLDNNKCVASGWGKNGLQRGRHPTVLRKVTLPLVQRSKCQISLRNTRLGKMYKLHKSFICAGGEKNRDTCKGDGGSPLICSIPNEEGRFVQLGIVSWGIGCGVDKTPGVYVNLLLYINWIDEQMLKKNLNTSYYKI